MKDAEPPDWDLVGTETLGPVITHGPGKCGTDVCVIHNPSQHHMLTWELSFNSVRAYLALRICSHGHEHPDPDSLAYFATRLPEPTMRWLSTHLCDNCCHPS